jgi:hypothetical protein
MTTLTQRPTAEAAVRPRRFAIPLLSAVLLFQGCLLAGVLLSPLVEMWRPLPADRVDVAGQVARWRRSLDQADHDPRAGDGAPLLRLRSPSGAPVDAASLRAKRAAILFVRDGAG